jgi:hypothetical protein
MLVFDCGHPECAPAVITNTRFRRRRNGGRSPPASATKRQPAEFATIKDFDFLMRCPWRLAYGRRLVVL